MQHERAGTTNARLSQADMMTTCRLSNADHLLLERAVDLLQLSARSMHRILRVARTIADLAGDSEIDASHLGEAISYRRAGGGLANH